MSAPVAKRPRKFVIEELCVPSPEREEPEMAEDTLEEEEEEAEESCEQFFRQIGEPEFTPNKKFILGHTKTRLQIEKIELAANPENLLYRLLQRSICQARAAHLQHHGVEADQLGVFIESVLLQDDIVVPMRPVKEDVIERTMNEFMMISQSRERDGTDSLLGAPFNITVYTGTEKALPAEDEQEQLQIMGSKPEPVQKHLFQQLQESALIRIKNTGNPYCLFYALELTRIRVTNQLDRKLFHNYLNRQHSQQLREVKMLMTASKVPLDLPEYDACIHVKDIVNHWNEKYAADNRCFKVFIFEATGNTKPIYTCGPDNYNTAVCILYQKEEKHFHGIRFAGSLFGRRQQYCFHCLDTYKTQSEHTMSCKGKCKGCGRVKFEGLCTPDAKVYIKDCQKCGRHYQNRECFKHHLKHGECQRHKQCPKCSVLWNTRTHANHGKAHVCGHSWCKKCLQFHQKKDGCFIQPLKLPKEEDYREVFFDSETTQCDEETGEEEGTSRQKGQMRHRVNFIAALVCCSHCNYGDRWKQSLKGAQGYQKCEICGPHRTITFSVRPFKRTDVDMMVVTPDPLGKFIEWLLALAKDYVTMVFSHYGGKFDMLMAFKELYNRDIYPELEAIKKGQKLIGIRLPQNKNQGRAEINFRDSHNILQMALGKLVKAYGLSTEEKQFFPHLANRPENYDKTIPLPPPEDYLVGGFLQDKAKEFHRWHSAELQKGVTFELNEALAEYCLNDVMILTEALIIFREEFMETTKRASHVDDEAARGIDVLRSAHTISAACMQHFRLNHLRPNTLALVRESSYDAQDTQSHSALQYLDWYAVKHGVQIQTANSRDGEYRVGRYRLDGYIQSEDRGIEVNGCLYHACPRCLPDPSYRLPFGELAGAKRAKDAARLHFLRQHLKGGVDVIWACEIDEMKKSDPEMCAAYEGYKDDGPIDIKKCFHGGRTGPFTMLYKVPPGKCAKYLDFNSLYPSVNATCFYPLGHPEVIVSKYEERKVCWTQPSQIPIDGIIKVFLVPPTDLLVPVMPVRFKNDSRLLFPLCKSCSLEYPQGTVLQTYSCPHTTDNERGWVSTTTTIELAEALKNGYVVTEFYRGYHYKEFDDQLFRSYIAEMMEHKIHASGYPEEITTDGDKQRFIRECDERFGIKIRDELMVPNAARRQQAKLGIVNLWGKFGQRNNMPKTVITKSPAVLKAYMKDPNKEIYFDELNEETIMASL